MAEHPALGKTFKAETSGKFHGVGRAQRVAVRGAGVLVQLSFDEKTWWPLGDLEEVVEVSGHPADCTCKFCQPEV